MKLGLRSRILIIAAGVVLLASIAIATTLSISFNRQYLSALQSRSAAVSKGLAIEMQRLTALGMHIDDFTGFEGQYAKAISHYSDIKVAMIVLPDGKILYHNDHAKIGTRIDSAELLHALDVPDPAPISPIDGSYYFVEPLKDTAGTHVADIIVGFSALRIENSLRQTTITALVAGFAIGAVGLLILYLMLNRYLVAPILAITTAQARLRYNLGDYSIRVAPQGNDEIGELVDGFNGLLNQVEKHERELELAREASDRANKAKSDFLAAMSHDLRAPMHAVLSMNELMLNTKLTEKQQRFAQNTLRAGHQLLAIINDILEYARVESGKLELSVAEFDLHLLLDDVVQLQDDFARNKKLKLTYTISKTLPRFLIGDGQRLTQMLTNLVSNAIKFTDSGSVHIDVMAVNSRVAFTVTDTGIGVDKDKQHLLFQPFTQVIASSGKRRGGTGLGLSVVKQLAEAMGGEVGVDTVPEQGATFWFTAQLQPASSQRREQLEMETS